MKLVIIESPYRGDNYEHLQENIKYARACVMDSLMRHDESPIASHLLFTQEGMLDDRSPTDRLRGLLAGQAWLIAADLVAVYTDRGISSGMQKSINLAGRLMTEVEYRSIENKVPHAPIDETDY